MSKNEIPSMRSIIMDNLKSNFGDTSFWRTIEVELAVLCAELPEVTSEIYQKDMVNGLKAIRDTLIGHNVDDKDLEFLNEEIERHMKTKQISLYTEEDDLVEKDVIEKYSRLSIGAEGVMGIHLPYNYLQSKRLTNGVYNRTGLIKFYISREKTVCGKITAEIYEYSQKIPIATLLESKKRNKDTGEPLFKYISLFGEKINPTAYNKIKEIEIPFYVYRFITETNHEFILFTVDKYDIGDYVVTGMQTQCDDYKMLTDSAKLPTKLPFFFAQRLRNRIIKFANHKEFLEKLNTFNYTPKDMFDFPFSMHVKRKNASYLLNHPEWFKWFIWSWLTHAPVGLMNDYPMHILMLGPPSSGKSWLLNSFHARTKESRHIFSGSSSTLKNLIPSFKYNPAKLGYLAESNRFAYCDEFLRCMVHLRNTVSNESKDESVAMMNDLLEHQKREAGSGISKVNVTMTARMLATTNPVRGIHTVTDLLKAFDGSFLSRVLLYPQTQDHVNMIRKSKDSKLKKWSFRISSNEWVSILDYLHTFSCDYNMDKVDKIYTSVIPVLNEALANHYDARHNHHIECIIDGLVKARCLSEKDMSFKAKPIDYERLELVWKSIIRSWIDGTHIKKLPVYDRIYYLPADAQWIYWRIVEFKRAVSDNDIKKLALNEMTQPRYMEMIILLIDNELLISKDNTLRPHSLKEIQSDDKQQRI